MTRNLALVFLVSTLAFSSCKKLQLPGVKKAQTEQQSTVSSEVAAVSAPAAPSAPDISAPPTETKQQQAAAPAPESTAATPPTKAATTKSHSQVVVLCYHRIEGKAGGALSIEPALFEQHMQQLKDAGVAVISMQDFFAWRRGEKEIPPKCALITIDDGYVSGYEVAWPILKKYGYPFTMFVYLKYISTGGKAITWDQLAEMRDAGVDIGSHTVSHQDLRKPGKGAANYEAYLKDEVERSKQVIEEKLGIKVLSLAYPQGRANAKVAAETKAAGYEGGFTTYGMRLTQNADAYALGRYDVKAKDAQGRDGFTAAISFNGMVSPGADPLLSQEAAVSMVTQPANDSTIKETTPTLKANLSTMGDINPSTVEMRISGVGLVKPKYDPASKMLTYTITEKQKLRPGSYTVLVSAMIGEKKAETRWTFHVDPNAAPAAPEEAPLPPRKPQI
ncbi:polysaccharide deacetylase family protein [Verrucomicrobiota bacterium sgz303538]